MGHDRRQLLLIAAIAAAIWLVWKFLAPDIDLEEALGDISDTLGAWTYGAVGLLAFLETGAFVGLVVPGETVVVLGGAIAGQGEIEVILLIAIVWCSAFAGDTVSYLIGRRFGRDLVLRHGHKIRITPERFAQVERHFERHGGSTILIGRFIGIVRALAPFVAGSSGMRYRAMAPYSVLGTGLWSATFIVLGYIASRNLNAVLDAAERGSFWFGVLLVTVIASVLAVRFMRVPENRARLAEGLERRLERSAPGRWVLALARRSERYVRFVWGRLTPGNLGLELTSLVAVIAVGGFVFGAYVGIVAGDPGPTPGDETSADIAEALRAAWLTSVAKIVTALGAWAAVTGVAVAAGAWLAWRRAWAELAVLVLGLATLLVAVPEIKDEVARPRPAGSLVGVEGQALPSGHAAYSAIYVWLAATIAIREAPSWVHRGALIAAGIAVAALVGLSRVYLGAHYMSDVSAGWGLGAAVFAIFGAVALVISHLRNNQPAQAPPAQPG